MPGPSTFNTPARIITYAMRNAGKLGQDSEPTPSQYAEYLNRLNDVINFEQTQGLKLWVNSGITLLPAGSGAGSLVVGQGRYRLSPTGGDVTMTKPLRIIWADYIDPDGNRRPIEPQMSQREYDSLSTPNQAGTITGYRVDKGATFLDVYLWMPPDATAALGSVLLVIQRQIVNPISLTEAIEFPQEWFIFLHWALAAEIATGQPQAIIDRCDLRTKAYREALEGWDVEDASTRFVPDSRSTQTNGSFR